MARPPTKVFVAWDGVSSRTTSAVADFAYTAPPAFDVVGPQPGDPPALDRVTAGIRAADRVLVLWSLENPLFVAFQYGLALAFDTPTTWVALSEEATVGLVLPDADIYRASLPDDLWRLMASERPTRARVKHASPGEGTVALVPPGPGAEEYRAEVHRSHPGWETRSGPPPTPLDLEFVARCGAAGRLVWVVTPYRFDFTTGTWTDLDANVVHAVAAGYHYGRSVAGGGEPRLQVLAHARVPPIGGLTPLVRSFEGASELGRILREEPSPEQAVPIHVERVELRNFKMFEHLLVDGVGATSVLGGRWTCLAGINGAGKSTVLQAVAMALLGPRQVTELGGDRLRRMVRRVGPDQVSGTAEVAVTVREGPTSHVLVLPLGASGVEEGDPRLARTAAVWERLRSRLVVSYGATRNIAEYRDTRWADLSPQVRQQMTLFDPFAQVDSVGVLLGEGSPGDSSSTGVFDMLLRLLDQVFGGEEVGLGRPFVDSRSNRLSFEREGAVVDAVELPDGFRAVVSWLADLCSAWYRLHPDGGDDPSAITGIVMVDEIDLHLHSRLQRLLVPRLRKALPGVQWIVTTHSPLILTSFEREELVLLDRSRPGGVWRLDRDIIGFSPDEVYDWLLDTRPRSAAIEEKAADPAAEDDIALLLYQSPDLSAEQAVEELKRTEAQILELKRRKAGGKASG